MVGRNRLGAYGSVSAPSPLGGVRTQAASMGPPMAPQQPRRRLEGATPPGGQPPQMLSAPRQMAPPTGPAPLPPQMPEAAMQEEMQRRAQLPSAPVNPQNIDAYLPVPQQAERNAQMPFITRRRLV